MREMNIPRSSIFDNLNDAPVDIGMFYKILLRSLSDSNALLQFLIVLYSWIETGFVNLNELQKYHNNRYYLDVSLRLLENPPHTAPAIWIIEVWRPCLQRGMGQRPTVLFPFPLACHSAQSLYSRLASAHPLHIPKVILSALDRVRERRAGVDDGEIVGGDLRGF